MFSHTFYINDLDNLCGQRASAINVIENILNKAYRQEMETFVDVFKKILMTKKPKVFCIYEQKKTQEVVIDKVQLESIVDDK